MNEEQSKTKEDEFVCDVTSVLKTIYEIQNKAKLPMFQGVFHETIPIILYSTDSLEPFSAFGIAPTSQSSFRTCFFRIEYLSSTTIHLSLLHPTDVEDNYLDTTCSPFRLKKTKSTVIVSLQCLCGIQCISPKLVNRRIIISSEKC
ncbi:MAG: CotY/CotZ family spore coat protein [Paenisporosarcina sp.]